MDDGKMQPVVNWDVHLSSGFLALLLYTMRITEGRKEKDEKKSKRVEIFPPLLFSILIIKESFSFLSTWIRKIFCWEDGKTL